MRSPSTGRVEVPFSARFHFARSGRNPDGKPVEGPRMVWKGPGVSGFAHRPVMVSEVVGILAGSPPGTLLDATAGGAGHARAVLEAAPQLSVVALDQDPEAVAAASAVLEPFAERASVRLASFERLGEVLDEAGVGALAGALFDLGVSSPQLDRPERGFSYRFEGPLDMRMDPSRRTTAADIVNRWDQADLARLIGEHGEARFARRIAAAIVAARPLGTTNDLVAVIKAAIPAAARREGGHPARRVFQALRVAVNRELEVLPAAIDAAIARLCPGGRLVVISYHSGEDRLVKERLRQAAQGYCTCPPELPCVCGALPLVRYLARRPLRPSADEVASNPRARSARLRAVERLSGSSGGRG